MKKSLLFIVMIWFSALYSYAEVEYYVTNIPPGDTLSVRQGAGASYTLVARLENNSANIYITGDTVMNGSDDWVPISFPNGHGWVRPKYLKRIAPPAINTDASDEPKRTEQAPLPLDKNARFALKQDGPPSPVDGSFVSLAVGLGTQSSETSPAGKFLHQLARITARYLLDTAYTPSSGSPMYDLVEVKSRAQSLAALLSSDIGQAAPAELRDFCRNSLLVDAVFQRAWEIFQPPVREPGQPAGQFTSSILMAMIRDLEESPGLKVHPWENWGISGHENMDKAFGQYFTDSILPAMQREQASKSMLKRARAMKEEWNPHYKWAELLQKLAANDPSLAAYAAEPRVTDPTWHFLLLDAAGDSFFGKSFGERGRLPDRNFFRFPEKDFGDVRKGPVLIHIRSNKKSWAFNFGFDDPANVEHAYVARCSKGHFGLKVGITGTIWAAEGMTSWINDGETRFQSNGSVRGHTLAHFPTTGSEAECETEGTLLIYNPKLHGSAAEAEQIARKIELFP